MTQWLYLEDSYLRRFSARVERALDDGVVLDRSTFYPGGGGQPADHGKLILPSGARASVVGFRRTEDGVVHRLDPLISTVPGDEVTGEIDWPRRYLLMRTHTAMHILSAVVWRDYQVKVTGSNMECGSGRLDFEFAKVEPELAAEIERKINEEVLVGHEVSTGVLPRAEAEKVPDLIRTKIDLLPAKIQEIRVVTIGVLDMQADGGTHVANTKEVGPLRITKVRSKGKQNKRLHIALEDVLTPLP